MCNQKLFICIKGYTVDGHDYAQKAVDAGATVIVTEKELQLEGHVAQVIVEDTESSTRITLCKVFRLSIK